MPLSEDNTANATNGASSDSANLASADSASAAAQPLHPVQPTMTANIVSPALPALNESTNHSPDDLLESSENETAIGCDGMWRIEFQKLAKPSQFDVGINMRRLLPLFCTGAESNTLFHICSKTAQETVKTMDEFPDAWEDFIEFFHCKRDNNRKKCIVAFRVKSTHSPDWHKSPENMARLQHDNIWIGQHACRTLEHKKCGCVLQLHPTHTNRQHLLKRLRNTMAAEWSANLDATVGSGALPHFDVKAGQIKQKCQGQTFRTSALEVWCDRQDSAQLQHMFAECVCTELNQLGQFIPLGRFTGIDDKTHATLVKMQNAMIAETTAVTVFNCHPRVLAAHLPNSSNTLCQEILQHTTDPDAVDPTPLFTAVEASTTACDNGMHVFLATNDNVPAATDFLDNTLPDCCIQIPNCQTHQQNFPTPAPTRAGKARRNCKDCSNRVATPEILEDTGISHRNAAARRNRRPPQEIFASKADEVRQRQTQQSHPSAPDPPGSAAASSQSPNDNSSQASNSTRSRDNRSSRSFQTRDSDVSTIVSSAMSSVHQAQQEFQQRMLNTMNQQISRTLKAHDDRAKADQLRCEQQQKQIDSQQRAQQAAEASLNRLIQAMERQQHVSPLSSPNHQFVTPQRPPQPDVQHNPHFEMSPVQGQFSPLQGSPHSCPPPHPNFATPQQHPAPLPHQQAQMHQHALQLQQMSQHPHAPSSPSMMSTEQTNQSHESFTSTGLLSHPGPSTS